jgi:uncharacterized protein
MFMNQPVSNLTELLASMTPVLNDGVYVFSTVAHDTDLSGVDVVAMIREREGISVILAEEDAYKLDLEVVFRAAWISLTVHSDLEAVGLTAAFARALGDFNVSCNVIAGLYHDHIFVPVAQAQLAMQVLNDLQKRSRCD